MSDHQRDTSQTTADLAWLEADLSAVEDLLAARTEASDPVGWMQFQQRKAELESRIATLKGGTSQTTVRRRIYVVRIECPDERSYDLMYRATEDLICKLWDRPPVFLSGGMENQNEQS